MFILVQRHKENMPRGGHRPNTKVESNHLFKPKWNNKKTTAIRIPEVFKDILLSLARYFDKPENTSIVQSLFNAIQIIENHPTKFTNSNSKQTEEQQNKYQIAVECFEEFVENQNLNMEELSKSRKGTKKHQLWLINNWFQAKSREL